jgi:hypothetical protein
MPGMNEFRVGLGNQILNSRFSPTALVRYLVACNISILQPGLRKALASTAPFLRILRGLKKL